MLLPEYAVVRCPLGEVLGISLLNSLPRVGDFDSVAVSLYRVCERLTFMLTFLSDGEEFDTIGIINPPDDVVAALEKGISIQDESAGVDMVCQVSTAFSPVRVRYDPHQAQHG